MYIYVAVIVAICTSIDIDVKMTSTQELHKIETWKVLRAYVRTIHTYVCRIYIRTSVASYVQL